LLNFKIATSPYINHFIQPDTIIPNPADPQSWNRYSYVDNNPIRYTDPTGHKVCSVDDNGGCDKKEELWNYAYDTLKRFSGKNDLEAMVRIVNKASRLYRTFDKIMPELSEIFLGVHESNPLTILHAAGADSCAGLGREPKDCSLNTDADSFWNEGFHRDFQDGHNQVFHFWAYVATTASTDMPVGGYALGYIAGQGGNYVHENLAVGDPTGATWQDYALAQAGMNTGVMISFGAVSPNELGNYIRDTVGINSAGAPYVTPLVFFLPLLGNMLQQ
jgi:hypothetical protein